MNGYEGGHMRQHLQERDEDGVALQPARDRFTVQKQGEAEKQRNDLSGSSLEQSSYGDRRSDEAGAFGDIDGLPSNSTYDDESRAEQSVGDSIQEAPGYDYQYNDIRSELEHLSQMQVDPNVGLKIAKSRMLLQVKSVD